MAFAKAEVIGQEIARLQCLGCGAVLELGLRPLKRTVYVGRPTKWGNPFHAHHDVPGGYPMTPEIAVDAYRDMFLQFGGINANGDAGSFRIGTIVLVEDVKRELRGKNLACWCPLGQPCHADILLEIANQLPFLTLGARALCAALSAKTRAGLSLAGAGAGAPFNSLGCAGQASRVSAWPNLRAVTHLDNHIPWTL